ncbi:DUF6790 family protein [Nocardioides sp. GXQ0305]|uniref:DUF6790 family protein n=1 Tax=Nocardioides sp. GXQ0305 TaxID=3423912 RepID=UPI003D7F05B8
MVHAAVGLFMLVLPGASVAVDLGNGGDEPVMAVVGTWFVFWAVGVRLLTAGLRQVVRPGLTAEGILGVTDRRAWVLVRELGFANVAIGAAGVLSLWAAGWRPAAALAGGLFLLLAGAQHLTRSHRNGEENVAMVSDLAIGVLMLGYVAWAWT